MSTVGLTKAMLRDLEYYRDGKGECASYGLFDRLCDMGLVDRSEWILTPRGHAALAAPRMTQGEDDVLAALAVGNVLWATHRSAVLTRCERRGWVHDATVSLPMGLTPAGRTALNNVRAAMPGPWEPMT